MGFLKPRISRRQPKSQATPLAEDVLGLLQRQLTGGVFGQGLGPIQQEAGTAIRQFINSRQDPGQFAELMNPLRQAFNLQTEQDVASTREAFGAQGGRLSTGLARAEGRVRNERESQFQAQQNQLFMQDQQNLLNAIGLFQQMGIQNIEPFLQFAALGILPEQMIIRDSPYAIGLNALANIGHSAALANIGRSAAQAATGGASAGAAGGGGG